MPTAKAGHLTLAARDGVARELDSKYEALFDQASDAILTISPEGRIDAANDVVVASTGADPWRNARMKKARAAAALRRPEASTSITCRC